MKMKIINHKFIIRAFIFNIFAFIFPMLTGEKIDFVPALGVIVFMSLLAILSVLIEKELDFK